ncbi:hypothetical protein A2U01_0063561 [Trifolium medium]|uniref:Uncharacterized protein n=1 Tax=Trifolium medium TaxID=97028 RepID=A0A392S296_9FABA|nr:hypothetical protein [Trifolium medium]
MVGAAQLDACTAVGGAREEAAAALDEEEEGWRRCNCCRSRVELKTKL